MPYRVLADLTVALHRAFIVFVMVGGFVALRRPWVAWLHLPAALWGIWTEWAGRICPLTPLENWLRQQAGEGAYAISFVDRYLMPVLYPESLTREVQVVLGAVVVVVNAVPYTMLIRRRRTFE